MFPSLAKSPQVVVCRSACLRAALSFLGLALLLSGCALAPSLPTPPTVVALPAQPDGEFADAEAGVRAKHGERTSGFWLLREHLNALVWGLALIYSARYSLDLQYCVWFEDKVGQLLMSRLIAAADRGVWVRIFSMT